jgi:hypothetical protein
MPGDLQEADRAPGLVDRADDVKNARPRPRRAGESR